MRATIIFLMGAMLTAFRVSAADAAPENTGLAVGQPAPAFSLRDQNGKDISLESLLKAGPVALVFHRSADW